MPTPTGLPKPGEVWRYTQTLPPDWKPESVEIEVLERGRGDYWSLRVRILNSEREYESSGQIRLWVDASYYLSKGDLVFLRSAA